MNSIIKELRLSLAREEMESNEGNLPDGSSVSVPASEVPEDVVDQVFHDDAEILALEHDIDVDEKVLESLIVNGETLVDLDLALESFRYSGLGIDDVTYTALRATYHSVTGTHLPALENALIEIDGDRKRLLLATEAAVGDKLKEMIKKIIDTIISLYAKVRDWYVRVFDQAAKEQRRAKKIHKSAASITGAPNDTNVTLESVREIGIGNKAVAPGKFLGLLVKVTGLTDKLTGDLAKEYNRLMAELTTLTRAQVEEVLDAARKRTDETLSTSRNDVEVPKAFVKNDDKMLLQFIDRFSRMIEMLQLRNVPKEDDPRFSAPSTVYHLSDVLPGNKQLSSAHPDKTDDMIADLGKIKNSFGIGVVEVAEAVKAKGKLEIAFETLSITDIQRLAEECSKLCDFVIKYRINYKENERTTDQFLKSLQNISRSNEEIDQTARQQITSIVGGATTIHKNMTNGEGRWVKYVMDIVVHTLDWCVASMAQYDHGKINA